MKKQREVQEINASSMADISFLLLVFFLVTTTMATDEGLARQLPPMKDPKQQDVVMDIKPRNIMEILVNSNNDLMVNGEIMNISQLKEEAKAFISSDGSNEKLPEAKIVHIDGLGDRMVATAHVISLQNDRGTDYGQYIAVQNELVAAYNELREALSQKEFKKSYDELGKEEQSAIRKAYPQAISEAEPKTYGGGN